MRRQQTRSLCFAILFFVSLICTGCQRAPADHSTAVLDEDMIGDTTMPSEEGDEFWILMEEHEAMEFLVNELVSQFQEIHPELQIKLQVLPNGNKQGDNYKEAREILLQQLRTQIMARKGPDVYLMPSVSTTYEM